MSLVIIGDITQRMRLLQLTEDTQYGKVGDFAIMSLLTNQILMIFTSRPDGTNYQKIAEEIINNYVGDNSEALLINVLMRGAIDLATIGITTFEPFCNRMKETIEIYEANNNP